MSTRKSLFLEKVLLQGLVFQYLAIGFPTFLESLGSADERLQILRKLKNLENLIGGRDEQGEFGPYQEAVSQVILDFEHEVEGIGIDEGDFDGYPEILFDPAGPGAGRETLHQGRIHLRKRESTERQVESEVSAVLPPLETRKK